MVQFSQHKANILKALLVLLGVAMFTGAVLIFTQSEEVAHKQAEQSQRAVANHTQTLNEIQQAVAQLKANNQTNHDTTIKYIQCVVESLTVTNPQVGFNACLAVSGVQ